MGQRSRLDGAVGAASLGNYKVDDLVAKRSRKAEAARMRVRNVAVVKRITIELIDRRAARYCRALTRGVRNLKDEVAVVCLAWKRDERAVRQALATDRERADMGAIEDPSGL